MPDSDDISVTRVVIGELVAAAKTSPDMGVAGAQTAESLRIVATTVRNVLLPLAAINYGVEKARIYFSERFASDLEEKVQNIPAESLIEPKAYLAGPILQGIAYSHDEAPLKDMYLNLLKNSMDGRQTEHVHPAHVEVIKQLTTEEVKILNGLLRDDGLRCIAQIRVNVAPPESGYSIPYQHLLNLGNDGIPYVNSRLPAMVSNWIRLGLIDVTYENTVNSPEGYAALEKRPELENIRATNDASSGKTVTLGRGALKRSEFGREFAISVGINAGVLP